MSKVKRLLKIGILFMLFIILAFIMVLTIFFVLDKYNLFNNISKMIITVLFSRVAVWFGQFLVNKIYFFDKEVDS